VVKDSVIKYRRAMAMAISSLAVACATVALIDAFDVINVPGGAFFGIASWLLLCASWIFMDVSSRWRTPKLPKTGKWNRH
jgi:hypothetical protein